MSVRLLVCSILLRSEYILWKEGWGRGFEGWWELTCGRGEVRYTYTGNETVMHTGLGPAVEFSIVPTEVTAVA